MAYLIKTQVATGGTQILKKRASSLANVQLNSQRAPLLLAGVWGGYGSFLMLLERDANI